MQASPARRIGDWCGACGSALIDPRAETCPRCEAVVGAPATGPRKGRITAALLAFFFGGFGVHRFYLGQPRLGALYLLFSWTLLPGLVTIVDVVRLLAATDAAFEARYGRLPGGGAAVAFWTSALAVVLSAGMVALALPRLAALEQALAAGLR